MDEGTEVTPETSVEETTASQEEVATPEADLESDVEAEEETPEDDDEDAEGDVVA